MVKGIVNSKKSIKFSSNKAVIDKPKIFQTSEIYKK